MTNSMNWQTALTFALAQGWTDEQIASHLFELVLVIDHLGKTMDQPQWEEFLLAGPIARIQLGFYEDILKLIS